MKTEASESDRLLIALSTDFAPPITIKSRCAVRWHDHDHFRDVMAGLIDRGLVETGLHSYGPGGNRCSYRLSESGQRRKESIDLRKRNEELFACA